MGADDQIIPVVRTPPQRRVGSVSDTPFEAAAQQDRQDVLRRELAAIEREQGRMTDAVASGAGQIPALVERLRTTERKRRALVADLERAREAAPAPLWRAIERRMRSGLADWRSRLTGEVADVRESFRQLLTTPIRFTPFVDQKRFQAIRFEGRWGLEAVFAGVVTQMASPGD